jgi:septal ring factor EnvC (AmiA/AmiB activator)
MYLGPDVLDLRIRWTAGFALAALIVAGQPAFAAAEGAADDPAAMAEAARAARQAQLDKVAHDIALTDERLAELRAEIESLDQDRGTLTSTLLETGKRVQALETKIGETETRIQALVRNEDDLRASLKAQRNVLGEVLAALQRIGRRPPPAILVRPEDALASVRSAIPDGFAEERARPRARPDAE